jgi:putative transposase
MSVLLESRPPDVSVRAGCAALALSRASYYRYSSNQTIIDVAANDAVSDAVSMSDEPASLAETTAAVEATATVETVAARAVPDNALSAAEQEQVLTVLNSERFADQPPAEVYATLLSEGIYYCSVSTMYRILRKARQTGERRPQRQPQTHAMPRLRATRPNEVWTWDITKLATEQRGVYLSLYVVLDLYSRFIVAWMVSRKENSHLAKQLMQEASTRYRIGLGELTLHQDRGAPMTAHGYLDLMAELEITCSHSRPRVSNDNPFSESQFKTCKQQPDYPGRFASVSHAREWFADYVEWYNFGHQHSGLAFFTPEQVFTNRVGEVAICRKRALQTAYETHPKRFINGAPVVKLPPKEVWINPAHPDEMDENIAVNFPTLSAAKKARL